MKVAFYESAQDNVPRSAELDWPELVAKLTTHRRSRCASSPCPGRCAAKNGPAWSPVDIVDRRRNENVRAVTIAVFDLDHLTEAQLVGNEAQLGVLDALDAHGLAWVAHSTHSNRLPSAGDPGDICLRLAIPLSRPVLPAEWGHVRAAAVRDLGLPADPATRDLARLYYLPDAPEGTEAMAASSDGKPLDVDALLASARTGTTAPAPVVAAAPQEAAPATETPVDLRELAELLRAHARPENRGLIGKVLRGEPFAPLGQQDMTLQTLMSTCAFCLPNETPDEVVVHLLRPSFTATDWQDGTEHLVAEALKKLHRARERKIARDEKRLAENRAIRERLGMREPTAAPAPVDEGAEDPEAWVEKLLTRQEKHGVRILNCEANVELVLRCSPEWRGVLRFNEVKKDISCEGGPVKVQNLDALEVEIAIWFQRSGYGELGLNPKPPVVRDCLKTVAYSNSHDPLRDYIEGLVWDGKHRVDTFLRDYFGAQGNPEYVRAVGTKWLISAVARALRPGCKVDTMLILEGLQGLGKSSAFKALGAGFFSDASVDIGNKDSLAFASQFWILEFAELKDVRRADAEALKAFLSRTEDTFRPPYGRVNVSFKRRCVFVGTTNAEAYLKRDPSGYRRFWPVKCSKADVEALRRDVPQIWAEAVVRFHQDEKWWLTDEEAKLAEEQTSERAEEVVEGKREVVLQWLLRMAAEKRPAELALADVAIGALQLTPGQITTAAEREVATALRELGFGRRVTEAGGVKRRVWVTPQALLTAPQSGR